MAIKKSLHTLLVCFIILIFIAFLSTLYVGVDPNSSFSDKLRAIPLLKIILKDKEPPGKITPVEKRAPRRVIYRYLPNKSGLGSTPQYLDTELLLPDTDLYAGPAEDQKLDEKTTEVKRYQALKRKGDWVLIRIGERERWVSPKRKNLLYYKMPEEMRRIIYGQADFIDWPLSLWYERNIGSNVKKILSGPIQFKEKDTSLGVFYCDRESFDSVDTILPMIDSLKKQYSALFDDKIGIKKEPFLPNVFLTSTKAVNKLMSFGDYSLGIISIDNFTTSADISIGVLLHEFTHHYNRFLLRLGGINPAPLWVNEGLCEYFSAEIMSDYTDKAPKSGKKISSELAAEIIPGIGIINRKTTMAFKPYLKNRIEYAVQLFKDDAYYSCKVFFSDDIWKKYGRLSGETEKIYASAWALTAYLIKGNDGKNFDEFCAYLKDLRDGEKLTISILDYLDIKTPEELDKAVKEEVVSGGLIDY